MIHIMALFAFYFEVSDKVDKFEKSKNIQPISITFFIFHFKIKDKFKKFWRIRKHITIKSKRKNKIRKFNSIDIYKRIKHANESFHINLI